MLISSIKQFKYYKLLAEKAMKQVNDEHLFDKFHEDDNSIALIVQHIVGNIKSRWTNIFTEDGEKAWRNRDSELEENVQNREQLIDLWETGWNMLFSTLDSLNVNDLNRFVYIRNEGLTISDALLRQLCHCSYHIGQIVYKCKQHKENTWQSLSFPKNASAAYNFKKFEQIREEKHYLDNLVNEGS